MITATVSRVDVRELTGGRNDVAMPEGRTKVSLFNQNTNPIVDRWHHRDQIKALRDHVMPTVLEKLGAPDAKIRWSQKMGCACGCSPGFIVDDVRGKQVFVDYSFEEVAH